MTGKYFLDTNFLVYCFSEDESDKSQTCQRILEKGRGEVMFVLSTQVLNEFAAVMLGKFKQPPHKIKAVINDLALLEVVTVNADLINEAIDIQTLNQLSYWDSVIIAAAKRAQCHTVITEDMQNGAILSGVRIQSPFNSGIL
ncbi:MAG: PIN domain-containing protein [Saprospiraceae bacterium]|jgi:predicted nucleic acid-binding protein|nr:PIN domain-containing protein [Saprospiraceae bacterium]